MERCGDWASQEGASASGMFDMQDCNGLGGRVLHPVLSHTADVPRVRFWYAGRGSSEPRTDTAAKAGLALDRRVDGTVLP
jgi:hypothetical protein